ncbi:MAG TPA: diguanylate cyclase [Stenotrophomonas sp.]
MAAFAPDHAHHAPANRWPRLACTCLLALLTLIATPLLAQNYSFRNYAQAEGLQGLSISTLYEDRHGVVWVGTELGLHRYERERFQFVGSDIGIDSIYIRAITEDRAGHLWVGTSNGLYVRDGERFTAVHWKGQPIQLDNGNTLAPFGLGVAAVAHQTLLQITPTSLGSWAATPVALKSEDGPPPPIGEALLADGPRLWAACGIELCHIDTDARLTRYGREHGLPAERWQAILRDSSGTLWLRGGEHVLSMAVDADRFIDRPPPAGGSFSMLSGTTNLAEDRRGRILTRSDSGLVRWEGDHWRLFGRSQGVDITPLVGPVIVQRDGRLWIGTRGLGIQRWLAYDGIEHWEEPQGLATAPTWSILRSPQGQLLVGSDAGSNVLDPRDGRMRPWTLADGSPLRQSVSMTVAPDGAVWVGRSSGQIARRDPHNGLTRDVSRVPAGVRVLLFDPAGVLWVATGRGVFRLAPGQQRPDRDAGLPIASYDDAVVDRFGRFWMVGSAGLFRRDGDRWQRIKVTGTLPSQDFSRLSVAPDGSLWISLSDAGLWHGRLDATGRQLALQAVDDPLVAKVMPYILRHDSRGWLWLGSSQGIDLLRDGQWTRVTQAEGLLWDDTSANAFFEDPDGAVWIGSSRGVSRISDPSRLFASRPLRLQIARMQRGGEDVQPGDALPWSEQPLYIDLSTPGASGGPDRITFRYRLNGYQSQWITAPQDHLVYPALAPGHYQLQVQAQDLRQRRLSDVTYVSLDIIPPWWRSNAALALYILAGAGVFYLCARWRLHRLRARERELERLVAERTCELEREKQELEVARAALAVKATRDDLTGLLNRTGILESMGAQIELARLENKSLAVVLIDLDHFKQINDIHGHLAGDAVLARVGRRLNACLRDLDYVGRYGGEELLAIMPGLTPDAGNRVQAIHDAICSTPYALDELVLEVTCSIGVAWYREGETHAQLLARADAALYRAKHRGRNRIELASPGQGEDLASPLTAVPELHSRR